MGRGTRGLLGQVASHIAAESDAERDAVRLEMAARPLLPLPARGLLLAAALVPYAAVAATLLHQGGPGWWLLPLWVMALADPLPWHAVRGRSDRQPGPIPYWGRVTVQCLAYAVLVLLPEPAMPLALLPLLPPMASLLLLPHRPALGLLPLVALGAVSGAGEPAAWGLLLSVAALWLGRLAVRPTEDAETEFPLRSRISLLEERMVALQSVRAAASRDPLTGVLNRRGFQAEASRLFNYVRMSGGLLGVMMLDIDHFKNVNDTWGHDMGDTALRNFSEILVRVTRPRADVVARLGGEEFAIITDDLGNIGDLAAFAERLRSVVEDTPWGESPAGEPLHFTCSIGFVVYPDCGCTNIEDLLGLADKALYEGKEGGRNQAVGHLGVNPEARENYFRVPRT